MMTTKIQNHHKMKLAYVYLRQSTMGQVRFNQESTERQYALKDKAHQLGWNQDAIKVLDGDLGLSGAKSQNRKAFKLLVADVSMGKVGAVFALEASRLSRSCTDWHRLLELCALTSTLIIDEDGCYNPADFNDQLLLGLKGTMSQAELHFIRARLQGGKINKAKKGELKLPLPVGFCYDQESQIIFDTDEQVREVIKLLFKIFIEKGSAYGVAHYFNQNKIKFPKRTYGGIWRGKLIWDNLTLSRVLGVLKNPSYAGAYVYGRYKHQKKLTEDETVSTKTIRAPISEWDVLIKDHHEAYITWETYLNNQKILQNNQTNTQETRVPTTVREGLGMLQGILICGDCGHRVSVRYKGKRGKLYPVYQCSWRKKTGVGLKECISVQGHLLDEKISEKVLEAIKPEQITIALEAFEEVINKNKSLDKQWQLKLTRAQYEVHLAQKRYEEVDPSNRLVAATLEKKWNEKLLELQKLEEQYNEYQQKNMLFIANKEKENLLQLGENLPDLWNASSTTTKDKKRIIRLLIKDITLEYIKDKKLINLHIRWQGGANESVSVKRLPYSYERWRHSQELIDRVIELSKDMNEEEIVEKLNKEGLKTNKGNAFTRGSIKWIKYKYKIPSSKSTYRKPNEMSVTEVKKLFDVSYHVVYYWIERGIVKTRRNSAKSRYWIFIDPEKKHELQ